MAVLSRPRTAVIGAGISGLTAGKMLDDYGVPYICFESSDRVGGNWAFGNPNGHSSAYRSLHIDTSKHQLSFRDFPIPDDFPDFPHHTQIKDYLDAYADAFGLREHIEFENGVVHAERLPGGGWEIEDQAGAAAPLRPARRRERPPLGPALRGVPRHVRRRPSSTRTTTSTRGRRSTCPASGSSSSASATAPRTSRCELSSKALAQRGHALAPAPAPGSCRSTSPAARRTSTSARSRTSRSPGSARWSQWGQPLTAGRPEIFGLPTPNHKFFEAHPTQSVELPLRLGSGDVVAEAGRRAARRRHRALRRRHQPTSSTSSSTPPATTSRSRSSTRTSSARRTTGSGSTSGCSSRASTTSSSSASPRRRRRCSRSSSARRGCWRAYAAGHYRLPPVEPRWSA